MRKKWSPIIQNNVRIPQVRSMDLTKMLERLRSGDNRVLHDIAPIIYNELKRLARAHLRREPERSLETTMLVHEAFIKLVSHQHPQYENRAHFYGIASRLMRQVLVDTARARYAEKRGAGLEVSCAKLLDVPPQSDRSILALNDALGHLQAVDPQKAKLIEMRYFAGMTTKECSEVTALPPHVIRRELRFAQAWLRKEMQAATQNPSLSLDLSQ